MRHSMQTRSKKNKVSESAPQRLTPVVRLTRCDSFVDCLQLSGDRNRGVMGSPEKKLIKNAENTEFRPLDSKLRTRLKTLKRDLNMNGNMDAQNDRRVSFTLEPPTRVYQIGEAKTPVKQKIMTPINPSDVNQFFGFDNEDNQKEFDGNSESLADGADNKENKLVICSDRDVRPPEYHWEPEFDQSVRLVNPMVYVAIFGLLMAVVCYFIYRYTDLLKV